MRREARPSRVLAPEGNPAFIEQVIRCIGTIQAHLLALAESAIGLEAPSSRSPEPNPLTPQEIESMKSSRSRRTVAILVAGALTLALGAGATLANGTHWTYEGEEGPAHWAELDPGYSRCVDMSAQSPINIVNPVKTDLKNLTFVYAGTRSKVMDNGHTVVAYANAASTGDTSAAVKLTVNGYTYQLLQMHFHAPSEHKINGKAYPAEAHFVFKNSAGMLAVVGVFLQGGGATNTAWTNFINATTEIKGTANATATWMPWGRLISQAGWQSVRYAGSLTTPPCSEGVAWNVMTKPVTLSTAQIEAIEAAYAENARPVQPVGSRYVLIDSSAAR